MRRGGSKNRHHALVDLTPMIDVVFQLIIFFMVTSHLGELRRTPIDLPRERGSGHDVEQDAAMIVDIDAEGRYLSESRVMTLDELDRVARNGIERAGDSAAFDVLIRPDKDTPAVFLDRLLTRLARAGVVRWKMGTHPEQGGGA